MRTQALNLDRYLDRELFALEHAAAAQLEARPELELELDLPRLIALAARLPSGLVHAAEIALIRERPAQLSPLAEGSRWYAVETTLMVVLEDRASLHDVLDDLMSYWLISDRFARRLGPEPEWRERLAAPELDPLAVARLASLLDTTSEVLLELDTRAPGLRADLAAMGTGAFSPNVRVHVSLRPAAVDKRGRELAEALLSRVPEGAFTLFLSDTPLALEHLSPYVRDLSASLSAWARENPEQLIPELGDALAANESDVDLLSLVVPSLFFSAPHLLEERRSAEASSGLHLWDESDAITGYAELSRLAAPDARAVVRGAAGQLALLITSDPDLLLACARRLFDSGRVSSIAWTLALSPALRGVTLIERFITNQDGVMLTATTRDLIQRAQQLGIELHQKESLDFDRERDISRTCFDLARASRRAQAQAALPEDTRVCSTFYPRVRVATDKEMKAELAGLNAARLAFNLLTSLGESAEASGSARGVSHPRPGISRRFRA